ncbi:DUF4159 domain-containing protein [Chelativorans sp. ZYF759]|uniref:DUF4159 domain-containing protein n=1 Tax=Chelativorans sp. ZYF759 TaxID=2692213 RepID=UPI00145E3308|nr:DUF4159 domain-containing protein [Chelativorans sp. ZYF759]NMG40176.1 DUF4159 domain-containing protein [Chelativorans sp. ZYF759]
MTWLPLSFGAPMVLAGLVVLPVIWWLLRMTPPKPQMEIFPPLRILASVLKREETPHQSPWWLTLLRLVMATLIILALADPVLNPRERMAAGGGATAILMDNGWASASDWQVRVATAERLIADAEASGVPVILAFSAEEANEPAGPFDAAAARDRLNAAAPRPVPVDRVAAAERIASALEGLPAPGLALLTDGLAADEDEAVWQIFADSGIGRLIWAQPDQPTMLGLTGGDNLADVFAVTAIRPQSDTAPRDVTVGAYDDRGRRLADAAISFATGEMEARGEIRVPFELRNDFSSLSIDGEMHAAATRVLDESRRRRRVALISQAEGDQAQPLLSPLHYINRALEPYADIVSASSPDLAEAIPELIEQGPAVIVMADVGTLPSAARRAVIDWVEGGGTLVRFAGSRLAAAENDPDLLPVRLRLGERALGGTLSWTEPQAVSEFPPSGPFADLSPPSEVTVTRQVLAEPSADIVDRTWANLADGTPLVTGDRRGDGTLVLFHVTPEATWSNLPISGSFVEMLRRIVQISRNQAVVDASGEERRASLPPYRMISANGTLVPPSPDARPLEISGSTQSVTLRNPPGLYGTDDGVIAHNLLGPDSQLAAIDVPQTELPVTRIAYAFDEQQDLRGPLLAAAVALMILDSLIVLWMGGLLRRRPRLAGRSAGVAVFVLAVGSVLAPGTGLAQFDDARPGDDEAIAAISETRIAYVITGDSSIDSISRAGIAGLSRFLTDKTALEPGQPSGVDIETDELSFYPLIYWPVDEATQMPSDEALSRIDAYMQQGGTVLFDTRDQYGAGLFDGAASPGTMRLREILSGMNVPPLEPVPDDHVLTKTFYILHEFPGRYAGGPLWVEAMGDGEADPERPVRQGDGVTPIMITANDFAGAWAEDANRRPMLPTVPSDPMQREFAMRAGVNIMMYMLTGNYKSDQVHVPAILERLGQ